MRSALAAVVALLALVAPVGATGSGAQAGQPTIDAAAWYLVGEDGSVLAGSAARRPRAVASITKLMTAVVALERSQLSDLVTVSGSAARLGESTVFLRAGEQLTVGELIRATLVPSANDAAQALAVHVGRGSADRFVGLMNAKARELGLADTYFENAHGLDESGHVSSARDATTLVRYALGVPFIRDALSRSSVTLPGGRTFVTTDDLLVSWAPLVGGKTGHTLDAGWSQAAAAERGGVTVYGTVLGSETRGTRNEALRELLVFGLDQYGRVLAIDRARTYATAETGYGQPDVDLVASESRVLALHKARSLVERIVAPTALALPVAKGQIVGRVEIYDGDRLVASSNLVTAQAVGDAGALAKAQWYATETVRNAWEIVT
jgi:D-alanyl-D-alanine carboxypeptidase (penicillin-binding protein 5/6)